MSGRVSQVVILAAGVGDRLRSFTGGQPKSLLELGGRTLLERHLDHLASGGVRRVWVVVGHGSSQVRERLGAVHGGMEVRTVDNPEYRRGSVLSLRYGLEALGEVGERVAWMDADVLYHPEVLHRLLSSEPPLCFLLDPRAEPSGEEMMLGVRGGRVLHIDRGVGPGGWDLAGESVGFFAASPDVVGGLRAVLDRFAAEGRLDAEYEEAVHALLPEVEAGYVEVGDLPWTEIDFPEDVKRAEGILEELRALGVEP